MAYSQLYKSASKSACDDQVVYELLVFIDALQGDLFRERNVATAELRDRLKKYEKSDHFDSGCGLSN